MIRITNAFSIQMLNPSDEVIGVGFRKLTPEQVRCVAADMKGSGVESYIGHEDTATVVSDILGVHVPANRGFLKLERGDTIIVAQLTGGRLPEGATTLPEGFHVDFWVVCVK